MMPKTKEEILRFVKSHKIKDIQLWFTDILGSLKCCSITSDELPAALNHGKGFDGSSVAGFAEAEESDILAKPDPSTFQLIPWEDKKEPVGRMFCDILNPDQTPYPGDPRYALKRNLERMKKMGFSYYYVGPELEYFYFKSPDMQKYEEEFKEAVSELKAKGIKTMVFGDIYLLEQINWVERVCKDLEIIPVEPLWNIPLFKIIDEFIDLGFKAIIVSCKADVLGKDFIGRYLDKEIIDEFKIRNICPCGENGEFHTFVVDGPIFKGKIEILESKPVLKDGFWKHWFLDITDYRCISKNYKEDTEGG